MQKRDFLWEEKALEETLVCAPVQVACCLRRLKKTGTWLMVQISTVNNTELGAQIWQDTLFLKYFLQPPNLPKLCDRCNATFYIYHSLDGKKGGLFTAHHNDLCDGVADLSRKYFTPTHVRNNPLIYAGRAVQRTKAQTYGSNSSSSTHKPEATE